MPPHPGCEGWPYATAREIASQRCNSACHPRSVIKVWPYTMAAPEGLASDRKTTITVEHSTPPTHHHHGPVSRSLALDQALPTIRAENGPRVGVSVWSDRRVSALSGMFAALLFSLRRERLRELEREAFLVSLVSSVSI